MLHTNISHGGLTARVSKNKNGEYKAEAWFFQLNHKEPIQKVDSPMTVPHLRNRAFCICRRIQQLNGRGQ